MLCIGIDPGVAGGVAVLTGAGSVVLVSKMPETPADTLDLFVQLGNEPEYMRHGEAIAVLEAAAPFAPFGMKMGAVSAFTFGKGIGYLEMALLAAGIPHERVRPQRWQTTMGCLSGGDKNITKARAQALFPKLTVTHAIADALLMAEFCRRYLAVRPTTRSAKGSTNGKAQSTETGKGASPEGRQREGTKGGQTGGEQAAREASAAAAAPRRHAEKPEARSHLRVAGRGSRAAQRGQR